MNKKTVKKPAARRTVAAKTRVHKSTTAKKTHKSVVAKKTTQRKGIKHHAKRIYRLTPKFVHGMIAGAFVGVVVVASLGISGGGVSANPPADACIKTQNGITINQKNANAFVRLADGCGKRTLVMKSYYAPSKTGEPHNQQVQFDVGTPTNVRTGGSNDWVKLNVSVVEPGCFYQVDLVDITNPAGSAGNPIVVAATGGNHDCTPDQNHAYACSALGLTPGDNRTVTISIFNVTSTNATYTGADINWGDGATGSTASVQGQSHQYSADNTYTVSVTAHFTYTGQFGKVHNVTAPACEQPITFNPIPGKPFYVCEISTNHIVQIDETLLGTPQYPADQYTTDLTRCVVTPPPTTPPAVLANTGPGAVLVVFGLAILGGYAFHMRHRHVQHKKGSHRTAHHAK